MTVELAVTVDEDQKGRLDAIAAAREETTADVLREAVAQYLAYDTWFQAEVQKGIESAERGELYDFEGVAAEFRQHLAALQDARR